MNDTHDDVVPDTDDISPFGGLQLAVDRRLRIATLAVGAAVIVVAAYLGWVVYSNAHQASTQSPAARAIANLTAIVRRQPTSPDARVKLAEALIANDQIDDAIAQLNAALKIDKRNSSALLDLGLISMQREEWAKAEGYWRTLIGILGKNEMSSKDQRLADVYYYLGTCMVEQGKYEDAVANLKQSISINRDSSPAHYMLSVAYARLNLPTMQEQELLVVVAFDPKQAQANYDLGLLALKKGDTAQAAEYFRVAVDNAPAGITKPADELAKFGTAASHLAKAQQLQRTDPATALKEVRIAAALDPGSTAAVRLVAVLAEAEKDPKRALNAWQRYLELVPGDPTATEAVKRLSANAQ